MSNEVKTQVQSESSIMVHPIQMVKNYEQFRLPTWVLIIILFAAFFILKGMIYIKDEKRHGK
jgi:uncharacterized membrane protein YozB (DUF420 family)